MSKVRRIGLTRDPPGGWPLDHVFVGVATLRTIRELFRQDGSLRAWDLSLRTGVTPQGSADALKRLDRLGLVNAYLPWNDGEAERYRLDRSHFLVESLGRLFRAEAAEMRRVAREASRAERGFGPSDDH